MSDKYKIQNYSKSLTIPLGSGSVKDTIPATGHGINGLLRSISVIPPASLTGTNYQIDVLGSQGESLFNSGNLAAGTTTTVLALAAGTTPAGTAPLGVPVSGSPGANWLAISVPTDTAAKGTLTSDNTDNSDGETVTIGSKVYTFRTNLSEAYATGVITSSNVNVSDGDTVTVGAVIYRFKTVPIAINDIFIGADADTSLGSLVKTINGTGLAGTDYFAGTTTPDVNVSASAVSVGHATTLTARTLGVAGNNVVLAKSAVTLTLTGLSGGKLSGGVDAIANEVKLAGGVADTSLTNLKKAINGEATVGTNYSTGTVAHADVTSAAVASHHIVITAKVETVAGDSIVTTTTGAHLSWGAATLTGSGEAADRLFTIDAYIER